MGRAEVAHKGIDWCFRSLGGKDDNKFVTGVDGCLGGPVTSVTRM